MEQARRRPADVDGTPKEEADIPVVHFTRECGRIRDVARTPDGGFWLLINNENPDVVLVSPPSGQAGSAGGPRFHMHQKFV